ncbi:MAG: hypothetical protein R3B65_00530 [Candidatus Paceibacterota bacterium]
MAELQKILQNEIVNYMTLMKGAFPKMQIEFGELVRQIIGFLEEWIIDQRNIATVIFGFVKPDEVEKSIGIILLDANKDTIENRIRGRYTTKESLDDLYRKTGKTLEKFIEGNVYVSSVLKKDV